MAVAQGPAAAQRPVGSSFNLFIVRSGGKLMEGPREFRFVSWNIPNLFLVEDNFWPRAKTPWRWADLGEMEDALESVRQMGGTVARTYVLGITRADSDMGDHVFVHRPGQFNEQAFQVLDQLLDVAHRTHVRLIIPLVDHWHWWGGIEQYAGFRQQEPAAFFTDRRVIDDFKQTIRFVLQRRNHLTGVRYCEDKAILGWETGNELDAPQAWTAEIAAYIKSLDANHLVIDGNSLHGISHASVLDDHIDVVTTHHYPGEGRDPVQEVHQAADAVAGRKPYVVGEFGFVNLKTMAALLEAVHEREITGALLWSLRSHSRDGGFYWHSEPAVGGTYKAYHWPGFPSGASYQEEDVFQLVREHAWRIRGRDAPPRDVPAAPMLLPVHRAGHLRWRGSAGASGYQVERALSAHGPWQRIGTDVSDAQVQYRPLFGDTTAAAATPYFYRVFASNEQGTSGPSNIVGPVVFSSRQRVDELQDLSLIHSCDARCRIVSDQPRRAREDDHRLAVPVGGHVTYTSPGKLVGWRVGVFLPEEGVRPEFTCSDDGVIFEGCSSERSDSAQSTSDYGYFPTVVYRSQGLPPGTRFLRVQASGTGAPGKNAAVLQLSWMELDWLE